MGDIKINESIKNLFVKLFLNKSLAEEFSKCETFDEFYDFCMSVEKGYTKKELIEAIDMLGVFDWDSVLEQEKSAELDEENLIKVSGGADAAIFKKAIAGFLSLVSIGTNGILMSPVANATNYESGVSQIGRKIKSKIDKMPKSLKYILTAAGVFLVVYTAKNFSRRSIIPSNVIGLSNPRNACYINAMVQQLYSIADFRTGVMSDKSGNKKIEALKTIFKSMDEGKPLDETTRDKALKTLGYRGTQESAYDFLTSYKYIGDVCERLGLVIDANPFNPASYSSLQDYISDSANINASSLHRYQVIIPFSQRPSDAGRSDFKAPQKINILGSKKYLTGAIIKTGSVNAGHYISYKKMAGGSWYSFSDDYVTVVTENEVNNSISENCTLLVYSS